MRIFKSRSKCTVLLLLFSVLFPARALSQALEVVATATQLLKFHNELIRTGNPQRDIQAINAQLAQIRQSLAIIDNKLDTVLKELRALGAKIDETNDENSRIAVLSAVDVITDNYRGWAETIRNPETRLAANNQLSVLENAVSNLTKRRSFANFHVVGYAMLYEQYMFTLLNSPRATRQDRFTRYVDYFISSQDPVISGSIANRHAFFKSQADATASVHARIDARNPISEFIGKERQVTQSDGTRETICKVHVHTVIVGSLASGYSFAGREIIRNPHDCQTRRIDPIDRPVPPFQGASFRFTVNRDRLRPRIMLAQRRSITEPADCPPSLEADPDSVCLIQLQQSREVFLKNRQNETELAGSLEKAREFQAAAQRLRDQ